MRGITLAKVGVSVAAICWSQFASAQNAPVLQGEVAVPAAADVATAADSLPAEIVVTATRRTQSLQDVPMSINVATGEQLQRLKILDFKDVAQLAPGLELTNTVGRNNTATIRGVSFDPDTGASPAVDLYLNEVPTDPLTGFTALYDIDQIEVLRGPQGALRGRTSPAGAITIRTRRPQFNTTEGYVQATGTNKHAYNVQGGVTLPLVADTLSMRASMLVDGNRINQVHDVNRDENSRSRTESGRLSLAWRPIDNLNVNLMYQYLVADDRQLQQVFGPGKPDIGNAPIALDDRLAVHEGPYGAKNNSNFVTLDANWKLDGVTLSFVGGRQSSKITQIVSNDVGNAIHNYEATTTTRAPINSTTAELRVISNNDGFFNWTVGGFFNRTTGTARVSQAADFIGGRPGVLTPDLIVPVQGEILIPGRQRSLALTGSARFRFTRQLTLELAARYTDIANRQVGTITIPGLPTPLPLVNANIKSHPLTGSATLTYEANRDLTFYAAYGRSFRAPTASVGAPQNVSTDLIVSRPETSNSFEIGAKTAFLDRRLSLDVSAFYQKFNNYISRFSNIGLDQGTNRDVTGDGVPDGVYMGPPDGVVDTSTAFTYNGDATIKGVEATLAGHPTRNIDFSVSASYVKARYDHALLPCTTLNGAGEVTVIPNPAFGGVNNVSFCTRNSRLADVPNFTMTANSEVRFPVGDYLPFIRGLLTYRPSVFSENVQFRYPHREMLNLYVGVHGPDNKWELSLFARNVLNQDKLTNTSINNAQMAGTNLAGGAAVVYDSGYRFANVMNPREFGLSASFRF